MARAVRILPDNGRRERRWPFACVCVAFTFLLFSRLTACDVRRAVWCAVCGVCVRCVCRLFIRSVDQSVTPFRSVPFRGSVRFGSFRCAVTSLVTPCVCRAVPSDGLQGNCAVVRVCVCVRVCVGVRPVRGACHACVRFTGYSSISVCDHDATAARAQLALSRSLSRSRFRLVSCLASLVRVSSAILFCSVLGSEKEKKAIRESRQQFLRECCSARDDHDSEEVRSLTHCCHCVLPSTVVTVVQSVPRYAVSIRLSPPPALSLSLSFAAAAAAAAALSPSSSTMSVLNSCSTGAVPGASAVVPMGKGLGFG